MSIPQLLSLVCYATGALGPRQESLFDSEERAALPDTLAPAARGAFARGLLHGYREEEEPPLSIQTAVTPEELQWLLGVFNEALTAMAYAAAGLAVFAVVWAGVVLIAEGAEARGGGRARNAVAMAVAGLVLVLSAKGVALTLINGAIPTPEQEGELTHANTSIHPPVASRRIGSPLLRP